jgi:signal transduction histidine kinase
MGIFRKLNRSLKVRFVAFLVLILTLAIGASSYLHLRLQYNQLMDISREKLRDIAGAVERSIKTSMEEGKSQNVKQIIEDVGTLPDIRKIRIFSKRGVILISSVDGEKGTVIDQQDLKLFQARRFSTVYDAKNLQQPVFSIIKPIVNQPRCFRCHGPNPNQINGVLEVVVSMQKVHDRLDTVQTFLISSTVITLMVLILSILFLLSHLVNRPIQSLIRTMRKAQRGDLTARVEPEATLEFGEVGRNFNSMISRLDKALTDLKHLHEQQMERVDRFAAIGELAAGIAHEIKNPIAGIGGAIQVLMEDFPVHDHRREIFEEILKQIDRIDQDVKDLLSYARTAKPALARRDINHVISQAIFLVRDRAAQQKVEIVTRLEKALPEVEIDNKQIQQVLVNLGLNSIQAMPEGGTLTFSSALTHPSEEIHLVEIKVSDTGKGIPQENLTKIFTPFFTTRHTGTGLGLPISQKIIHHHRGKIEVQSKPGEGTCFTILLPLARTEATA